MRKMMVVFGILVSAILSAQQVQRNLTASNGVYIGFWEYTPTDYNANPYTKYPVIVFLHGIGERGNGTSDLGNVTSIALPRMIANGNPMRFFWNGKWETFIVLSPQLSYNYGDWPDFYVDEMIKYATNNLRGDPNRVFLTGLSLGGGAVWRYGGANPQKLTAVAPVCPTCQSVNWGNYAANNLPVWAFHAMDDQTASWTCSDFPVNAINAYIPAAKAKRTLWPDGNHWIWDRAMDPGYSWQNPNLYEWFLGQDKFNPSNQKPVANAGSDITISQSIAAVTLNGGGSYDADGSIQRYVWTKISGPDYTGTIATPMNASTVVSGINQIGEYVYELKVADNKAETATARVKVTVTAGGTTPPPPPSPTGTNQPPQPKPGNSITITLPTNNTTLNGSGSYDPDGTISRYEWTKMSGPSQYTIANTGSATTDLSNLAQGTYSFNLRVWDNQWLPADAAMTVTVNGGASTPPPPAPSGVNQPPVPKPGNAVAITLPTNSTTLNGSGSYDPDGTIGKYEWTKISGPSQFSIASVNSASSALTNLAQGTYSFNLRVWDNQWQPADATVSVTVNGSVTTPPPAPAGVNQPPVPKPGNAVTMTLPTNSTTLNGSGSYDPDGTLNRYEWTKISGPAQFTLANTSGATTALTGLAQGTYTFNLRVWDNLWQPADATVTVTVLSGTTAPPPATGNQAPVSNAGNDATLELPSNSVSLNGAGSYDPDGTIGKYEWKYVSGPAQYSIANINASTTTVNNLTQGTYTFALKIWDNLWMPAEDMVVITVNGNTSPAPAPAPSGGNMRPVSKAGYDLTVVLPENSGTLNGIGSFDPDGTIARYEWKKIGGPAAGTITNPADVTTTVTGMAQGTYVFALTVWDNLWQPVEDVVVINVNPSPATGPLPNGNWAPVSIAGPDFSVPFPNNGITLSASGSYDPDGTIGRVEWKQESGPAMSTINNTALISPAITSLISGTYVFSLRVWDNLWQPADDIVVVTVGNGVAAVAPKLAFAEPGSIIFKEEKLSISPNPAKSMINVRLVNNDKGNTLLNVYDISGRVVKRFTYAKAQPIFQQQLEISRLPAGVYTLEVLVENKKRSVSKFVKQ